MGASEATVVGKNAVTFYAPSGEGSEGDSAPAVVTLGPGESFDLVKRSR